MLRLSRLADYGIVLLAHIAAADEAAGCPQLHSARQLGEDTGIPQPTVAKILKALVHGDLLESVRGPHGGYRLGRPAAQINVEEIVAILDGPIAVIDCADEASDPCAHEGECPVRTPMQAVNHTVRLALRALTLAELAGPASLPPQEPLSV